MLEKNLVSKYPFIGDYKNNNIDEVVFNFYIKEGELINSNTKEYAIKSITVNGNSIKKDKILYNKRIAYDIFNFYGNYKSLTLKNIIIDLDLRDFNLLIFNSLSFFKKIFGKSNDKKELYLNNVYFTDKELFFKLIPYIKEANNIYLFFSDYKDILKYKKIIINNKFKIIPILTYDKKYKIGNIKEDFKFRVPKVVSFGKNDTLITLKELKIF